MKKDSNISDFLNNIEYEFNNISLLEEALTHPSFSKGKQIPNYQRLEFLGDTVLSMVVAGLLIKYYPDENEGQLSKRQAYLVSGETIAQIAEEINTGKVIKLSASEESRGGRLNKRNLENVLEALIGAIYLDSGLENCKEFIIKYWEKILVRDTKPPQDPISYLQEIIQGKTKQLPQYQIERVGGDEHKPVFVATVEVNGSKYSTEGSSKKEAQKNTAKLILKAIEGKEIDIEKL